MAAITIDVLARDFASGTFRKVGGESAAFSKKLEVMGAVLGGAVVAGLGAAVKSAGDFQSAIVHLQTDAGESAKNIKMVSDGILKMAGSVGVSAQELTKGMYYIESAGYHGAAGLQVLKAAAQGAKVGNADLKTMADSVTSALNAYRLKGTDATMVTNEMIAAVAHGKMKMEDLAGSLGKVLPAAAAAHVGMNQVLGAIATMTSQGTAASKAATYLNQTILQLSNPTQKAQDEMKGLGLSAIDVSKNLGARGLTGTFDLLVNAIERKMGPAGTVLIESLKKQSKHTTEFQKILANLNPEQQTYVAALANMVGGTKSMQAALQLTGTNAQTFNENVKGIAAAAKDTAGGVKDWGEIQQTFNQKMDRAKAATGAFVIQIGNELLPAATKFAGWLSNTAVPALQKFGDFVNKNKEWLGPLAVALGTAAGAIGMIVLATKAWAAIQAVMNVVLTANPIGVIIIAIAALAAGIIYAYKHSETFRNIVQGAFHAVGSAASAMWNDAIRPAFKFIVDTWFAVVGALVNGAASAFGWMPGIGGKLKAAAKKFDEFRDDVNAALSGIHDRNVKVSADLLVRSPYVSGGGATSSVAGGHHFATGGLVTGGTAGRDSVPSMLTPGEFVVTADGKNLQVSGGGNTSITVNVAGSVTTERDLVQSIIKGFRDYQRRNGTPAVI